jgi:phosphate acyltransferase
MGGDHAPANAVAGALRAEAAGVRVTLVGDEALLRRHLRGAGDGVEVEVVHAPQVVGMGEDPAIALRSKRAASIRVAAALVAEGRAGALVSAGSTGATLAASLLEIGRLPGVRRPAVGALLPTPLRREGQPGGTVLVDAGASPDAQPDALVAYAAMGAAYAAVRGVASPRVGLLNVGAEPGKGSAFAKEAFAALGALPEFAGNVEPAGVLAGEVDVVVTDGFTGNVLLKTVEALLQVPDGARGPGAAMLLGCAQPVLVAHGDADPEELAAALETAAQVAAAGVIAELGRRLAPPARAGAPDQEVVGG